MSEPRELAVVVIADFSGLMADQAPGGRPRVRAMVDQIKRMADLLAPGKTPLSLIAFADQAQVALDWSSSGDDLRPTLDALASKPLPPAAPDAPYALTDALRLGVAQFAKAVPQLALDQRPRAIFAYGAGAPGHTIDTMALQDGLGQLQPNLPAITLVGLGGSAAGEFATQPGNPDAFQQAAQALPNAAYLPFFAADGNALIAQRNALDRAYTQRLGAQQLYRVTLQAANLPAGRHRIDIAARGATATTVLQIGELPPKLDLKLPAPVLQNRVQLGVAVSYQQRPIKQVEYFLEDQPLGVATSGPDFAIDLDVNGLFSTGRPLGTPPDPSRQYRISARATDASGLAARSPAQLVTFVPPAGAPAWQLMTLALAAVALTALVALVAARRRRAQPEQVTPHGGMGQEEPFGGRTMVALPAAGGPPTARYAATPRVVVVEGAAAQSYALQQDRQCRVGRSATSEIALVNHRVSRNHATLALGARGVELTDLGSANGTFVGEQKRRLEPNRPRLLGYGDVFWIGPEVKLVVEQ